MSALRHLFSPWACLVFWSCGALVAPLLYLLWSPGQTTHCVNSVLYCTCGLYPMDVWTGGTGPEHEWRLRWTQIIASPGCSGLAVFRVAGTGRLTITLD
ncbi:hypothetical protein VUR80DRAFT_10317 [Thermomyces stellatus]